MPRQLNMLMVRFYLPAWQAAFAAWVPDRLREPLRHARGAALADYALAAGLFALATWQAALATWQTAFAARVPDRLREPLRNERGASLTEYAIVVGLIAIVAIATVTLVGANVDRIFTDINDALDDIT